MKRFLLLFIVIIFLPVSFYGQSKDKELEVLREEVRLPDNEIIRVNEKIKFPVKKSLKVFLAINQNNSESENLENWLEKWNKKNGKKHGMIELVDEPEKADVIVAQYRTVRGKYVEESSIKIGNISDDGQKLSKPKVDSDYGYKRLNLPVYSYLLVRSNGFWTIVFHNVESVLVEEQFTNPDARLRGALNKRLKKR